MNLLKKNILIAGAWPYANGELHLGHVAAIISGDFLARYFRLKGNKVMFVSGSDCHGTPISVKAEELKITPKQVSDKYDKKMREALIDGLGFSYDLFFKTSDPFHGKKIQELFLNLYKKGYIYKKNQTLAYCDKCTRFLPDRFVEGTCPKCKFVQARGDQCDECGSLLDFQDLINPSCKICSATPREKETEHFFLKLTAFEKQLLDYIKKSKGWRKNARNFSIKFLEGGLHDRAITRDSNWGIAVPIKGYEHKVIYVWFEAILGYLTTTQKISEDLGKPDLWREFWKNDNAYHYYVQGKDNVPFHAIILSAILMGLRSLKNFNNKSVKSGESVENQWSDLHLPDNIVSSEYLNFDGKQFSKSRNWGVWIGEFLAKYEPDTIRYYLGINGPENRDSDFSWHDFKLRVNSELVGKLGNFVNRVLTFVNNKFDSNVPKVGNLKDGDKRILSDCNNIFNEVGTLIEKAKFKDALKKIMAFTDECNKYFNDQAPWKAIKADKERAATVLSACVQAISAIQVLINPFLPFSSEKIRKQLNVENRKEWKYYEISAGHEIGKVEGVYKKIDV